MSNNTLDWNNPNAYSAMLDRSPCGTGRGSEVRAKRFADKELVVGEDFVHKSILGSQFIGRVISETIASNTVVL